MNSHATPNSKTQRWVKGVVLGPEFGGGDKIVSTDFTTGQAGGDSSVAGDSSDDDDDDVLDILAGDVGTMWN